MVRSAHVDTHCEIFVLTTHLHLPVARSQVVQQRSEIDGIILPDVHLPDSQKTVHRQPVFLLRIDALHFQDDVTLHQAAVRRHRHDESAAALAAAGRGIDGCTIALRVYPMS